MHSSLIIFQLCHLECGRLKCDLVELYEKWEKINTLLKGKMMMLEEKDAIEECEFKNVFNDEDEDGKEGVMERYTPSSHDSGISDSFEKHIFHLSGSRIVKLRKKKVFKEEKIETKLPSIDGPNLSVDKMPPTKNHITRRKNYLEKVFKLWKYLSLFLFCILLLSVFCSPQCCENSNSLFLLLPSITYHSGPRPI